jgi:hypothetical protein
VYVDLTEVAGTSREARLQAPRRATLSPMLEQNVF